MTKIYYIPYLLFTLLSTSLMLSSCKKIIAVDPPSSSINGGNVYTSDATAAAVLTGLYERMSEGSYSSGISGISLEAGLSADEFMLYNGASGIYQTLYQNSLTSALPVGPWDDAFTYLETINSALAGLSNSTTLTPAVSNQARGEALFLRALNYYYLINLYGDVPLTTTNDWQFNSKIGRSRKEAVWQQVISDLKTAESLLSSDYLDQTLQKGSIDRVRPTTWAASAMLARTYLNQQIWDSAFIESSKIINNLALYALTSLDSVFLANSKEAIWQLMPVNPGFNTNDGALFILTDVPSPSQPVSLSPFLLNSFEVGDQRRYHWVDSLIANGTTFYYPFKYKANVALSAITEYQMVLRLGEQYLIRSEAEAHGAGSGPNSAINDLNTIRTRAGLDSLPVTLSQTDLISAIQHERQVELFTEWGDRWLTLKRIQAVDSVMSIVTPSKASGMAWQSYQQLYPLFYKDIQLDPNLTQTPGF